MAPITSLHGIQTSHRNNGKCSVFSLRKWNETETRKWDCKAGAWRCCVFWPDPASMQTQSLHLDWLDVTVWWQMAALCFIYSPWLFQINLQIRKSFMWVQIGLWCVGCQAWLFTKVRARWLYTDNTHKSRDSACMHVKPHLIIQLPEPFVVE